MRTGHRLALMISASMMIVGTAQAQDVLMRRPLPQSRSGPESPSTNPGTTNPTNPAPAPNPIPDGGTTTPTVPGTSVDPGQYVDPGTPYEPEYGSPIYWWQPGEWSGGTCGSQSTMTRSVTCMGGTFYGYPQPGGGDNNFQAVPVSSNGQNPFDLQLEDVMPVDASYCGNLEKVVTTYQGTQAGCDYQIQKATGSGQWKIASDAPGRSVCSPYAYREPELKCTLDGGQVAMGFCTQQLGSSPIPIADFTEHGNFEGCTYHVETYGSSTCKGDDYVETVENGFCIREDGEYMFDADAAACPELAQKTFPYDQTTGSCSVKFDFSSTGGSHFTSCTGDSHTVLFNKETVPYPTYSEASEKAAELCQNVGAECCQIIEQRDPHRAMGTSITAYYGNTSIIAQGGSYDYDNYGTQYRAVKPENVPN